MITHSLYHTTLSLPSHTAARNIQYRARPKITGIHDGWGHEYQRPANKGVLALSEKDQGAHKRIKRSLTPTFKFPMLDALWSAVKDVAGLLISLGWRIRFGLVRTRTG